MSRARSTKKKRIRILVADQEGVFRLGLKRLFGVEDDLRVVAEAQTHAQTLILAKAFKPEVIFVEETIVKEGSGDLLAKLRRALPPSKVLITGSVLSDDVVKRYVKAGAAGVILKSVDPILFVKCVRKVIANELWLPKQHVARMAEMLEGAGDHPPRPADTLTAREKTVISYLMQGWRNREIALHLAITKQTVKNHLGTIFDKVGVSDRLELVLYAIHQHLALPAVTSVAQGSQAAAKKCSGMSASAKTCLARSELSNQGSSVGFVDAKSPICAYTPQAHAPGQQCSSGPNLSGVVRPTGTGPVRFCSL